jgi:UDP-GlcNAc3NAcA epimerase
VKKIITVVGARPQFIKAAVVSRHLRSLEGMSEIIIHTGQHFDPNMSEIFFEEMEIPKPDQNLGINSRNEAAMTGEMILGLQEIFNDIRPDMVMVYGDTTSTLAAAIAARKSGNRLSHVEAGLRSFNRSMPEETNRILTDHVSDLLFCPTKHAVSNLLREGFNHEEQKIVLSGDVMLDAFMFYRQKSLERVSSSIDGIVEKGNYVLLTLHRQSNVDDTKTLSQLLHAIGKLSRSIRVVFPCHPRTRKKMELIEVENGIELIDPVGYLDMIKLLENCEMVLTDSGGLQKESYFAGKFCLTLRNETEWVELVEGGFNFLVGGKLDQLETFYENLGSREWNHQSHLYGNGNSAKIIADEVVTFLH